MTLSVWYNGGKKWRFASGDMEKSEIFIGESPLLPPPLIIIECHSELINRAKSMFIGKFKFKVD